MMMRTTKYCVNLVMLFCLAFSCRFIIPTSSMLHATHWNLQGSRSNIIVIILDLIAVNLSHTSMVCVRVILSYSIQHTNASDNDNNWLTDWLHTRTVSIQYVLWFVTLFFFSLCVLIVMHILWIKSWQQKKYKRKTQQNEKENQSHWTNLNFRFNSIHLVWKCSWLLRDPWEKVFCYVYYKFSFLFFSLGLSLSVRLIYFSNSNEIVKWI